MEKNKDVKILIVPDVHGRDFWRGPVNEVLSESNGRIIFLGDYHDPYPYEWEDIMNEDSEFDYIEHSFNGVQEIINLKKENKDRITLLIGNHDCGYAVGTDICECRRDRKNAHALENLFVENHNLFNLADEETINGKHFIFSHAGIGKEYADRCFGEEVNENNIVDFFNNAWLTENYGILDSLGWYDRYRGWGGSRYASLVWADANEWVTDKMDAYGISVVGHTQVKRQVNYEDKFYLLDSHTCSYIDSNGNVRDYNSDNIIEEITKDF